MKATSGSCARWGGLALALYCAACGGSRGHAADDASFATLSTSREAQDAFRPLARRFAAASGRERVAMDPQLRAFRAQFSRDPLARHADALLAWAALERGDAAGAARAAHEVRLRGGGAVGDLAAVIEGAATRRQGDAEQALRILRPLVGKVVDGHVRTLLDEEVVEAALATRRWDDAMRFIRTWLQETGEEGAQAYARIGKRLESIPPDVLFRVLEGRTTLLRAGDDSPDARRLRRLVAARLARAVRESREPKLARRVLDVAGALLGEDDGEAVAELASGATTARFEPGTVGLLLGTSDDEARRRGVAAATGIALGLGLPNGHTRLVSRDDGGGERTYEGLLSLVADGAGVIVAGTTAQGSETAAQFAQANRIPVILLGPLRVPSESEFVFEVGERLERALGELRRALEERGTKAETVWLEDLDASTTDITGALPCSAAVGPLRGRVVLGGEGCRSIIESAQLPLALGLDGRSLRRKGALLLTTGQFGVDAGATMSAEWNRLRGGGEPGWWVGLGHDAGVLAGLAMRVVAGAGTDQLPDVLARRADAAKALTSVEGSLWTTEATRFGPDRRLARTLRVAEVK